MLKSPYPFQVIGWLEVNFSELKVNCGELSWTELEPLKTASELNWTGVTEKVGVNWTELWKISKWTELNWHLQFSELFTWKISIVQFSSLRLFP